VTDAHKVAYKKELSEAYIKESHCIVTQQSRLLANYVVNSDSENEILCHFGQLDRAPLPTGAGPGTGIIFLIYVTKSCIKMQHLDFSSSETTHNTKCKKPNLSPDLTFVLLKPPSHQPRSHYVLQKLGGRNKNFVQRSMNAVETDKDVIWSPWTWRTWSNFGHVQKNVVRTWSNQDAVRT